MVLLYWPPGYSHQNHYHPRADESWFVCEGQVKVVFDGGKEMVAGPNSILFAKKGVAHFMIAVGKEPLLYISVVSPNEPDDEIDIP
jgi:mannose-6-phosphate isomerase-like protein (cupin superfamily)